MTTRVRADQRLVEVGLADTRSKAQALILAGIVYDGQRRIDKAGCQLKPDAMLEVRGESNPFVSRGGLKLAPALDALGIEVHGLAAADFGASTGGFTDCLLQRGATRVYAIDVGYGQLHARLRNDERVVVMERTNARYVQRTHLREPVDIVVIDASFIGLEKLLPAAVRILAPGGGIVAMVKPQFEVGPQQTHKGVVRDDAVRRAAVDRVVAAAVDLGLKVRGRVDSALPGPKGNREVFIDLRLRSLT